MEEPMPKLYRCLRPQRRALVLAVALLAVALPAAAGLIHAPGSAGSLQAAVDLAGAGDLILVAPGIYLETLVLRGGITLRGGGSRPEDTVLSGGYLHPVLSLSG